MSEYIAIRYRVFYKNSFWTVSYRDWFDVAREFLVELPEGCTEEQAEVCCYGDWDFPACYHDKTKAGLKKTVRNALHDGVIARKEYLEIMRAIRNERR